MQLSVAETTKQNIFIHEFIQPKHASNPWKLTVQNGSQVGGDRALGSKAEGPDTTAYHTATISRGEGSPGLVNPGQPEIPVSEKISRHQLTTCPLALFSTPRAEGHRGEPFCLVKAKKKKKNLNSIWGVKGLGCGLLALLIPALCQKRSLVLGGHGEEGGGARNYPKHCLTATRLIQQAGRRPHRQAE